MPGDEAGSGATEGVREGWGGGDGEDGVGWGGMGEGSMERDGGGGGGGVITSSAESWGVENKRREKGALLWPGW